MGSALPILYYSCRVWFLGLTIAFGLAWAFFGWDSTFMSSYGTGYHYSTFQTFTLAFYLLLVYFQKGTLRGLPDEVKRDFLRLIHFWQYRDIDESASVTQSGIGVPFIFFVTVGAMLLFEFVWVFFYDYFQFGSWLWPVYFAPNMLFRDVGLAFLCLAFAPVSLWLMRRVRPMKLAWRFDKTWALIVIATIAVWLFWLSGAFPHQVVTFATLAPAAVITPKALPANYSEGSYVFPAQQRFPQTEYTFYPSYMQDRPYNVSKILGFYVDNPFLHGINVLAKYLTYLSVCYPALLRVKR